MNRIKELRLKKNKQQKEVASELKIPVSTYAGYERNEREPKLDTWKKLADYFNVNVGYIQGVSKYKNDHEASRAFTESVQEDSDSFVHRRYKVLDPFLESNSEHYNQLFEDIAKEVLKSDSSNEMFDELYEQLDEYQRRRIAFVIETMIDGPSQIIGTTPSKGNTEQGSVNRFIDVMVTAANDWYEDWQPANADNVTDYEYKIND